MEETKMMRNDILKTAFLLGALLIASLLVLFNAQCSSNDDDDTANEAVDDDANDDVGDDDIGDDDNTDDDEDDDIVDDDIVDDDSSPPDVFINNGDGTVSDPTTGLMWQKVAPPKQQWEKWDHWSGANQYCLDLTLADHTDWRMPTISELRTIIRGCPDSMTGGVCQVSDECSNEDCWVHVDCRGCEKNLGPDNGCYWAKTFEGECTAYYSSTIAEGVYKYFSAVWVVFFQEADIEYWATFEGYGPVRCVRTIQ